MKLLFCNYETYLGIRNYVSRCDQAGFIKKVKRDPLLFDSIVEHIASEGASIGLKLEKIGVEPLEVILLNVFRTKDGIRRIELPTADNYKSVMIAILKHIHSNLRKIELMFEQNIVDVRHALQL